MFVVANRDSHFCGKNYGEEDSKILQIFLNIEFFAIF
jgi:hypothetical protein